MPSYTENVYKGLKKASHKSDRDGKWATPPEVRSDSVSVPTSVNVKNELMRLVRNNKAEKKKGIEYYRPANLGGGGMGNGVFDKPYRSPDGYDRPDTRGDERPTDGGRTATNTGDTVRAAVGAMVGGSLIPGDTTGGGTYTPPR